MSIPVFVPKASAALPYNIDPADLDAALNAIPFTNSGTGAVATDVQTFLRGFVVSSLTSLRATTKGTIPVVFVIGQSASGDAGGGIYYYDSTDTTSADNGGSIIVATDGGRWKLAYDSHGAYGDNLLPNTNWQLFSTWTTVTGASSAMKQDGTGLQSSISVTSFTGTSGQPTFNTANTQELYDGAIVTFGAGHGGLSGYGLRVFSTVANTSFKCQLPFSNSSPASAAITAYPVGIYDSSTAFGADGGWAKTSTLVAWADDFSANQCPGSKRVIGLRKASAGGEGWYWRPRNDADLAQFKGKQITFGAWVRTKSALTGSVRIYVNDGVTTTYSSPLTSGYTNANTNNFEFLSLNCTVALNATSLEIGLEINGASGQIFYLGLPTVKFGYNISKHDLGQPRHEIIRADTHWNPPVLTPFTGGWPGAEIIAGSGLYGWADLDLQALSYGQAHSSCAKVNAKIEFTSPTVGEICFVAALDVPNVQLTFALEAYTQVVSKTIASGCAWLPLIKGQAGVGSPPGCFAMFSNTVSGTITNITFDFDDVMA